MAQLVRLLYLSSIPSTYVRARCDCCVYNSRSAESEALGPVGKLTVAELMSPGSVRGPVLSI